MLSSEAVNWKAAVFWGVLLGLAAFFILQFYGNPLKSFLENPKIDFSWLTLDKITQFLKEYSFLLTGGAAAFTFLYGLYQKHQATQAALKLVSQQQAAETDIARAYALAQQYKQEAEQYKAQLQTSSQNNLNEALMEAQNLLQKQKSQFELEKANLLGQIQALSQQIADLKANVVVKEVVK